MRISIILLLLTAETILADEVRVERQKLRGPDRIHASLRVEATLAGVVAALETPCAVQTWLPGADKLEVLTRSRRKTEVRIRTRFPWPWHDRVARLVFHRRHTGDGTIITMRSRALAETPQAVEVPFSQAQWTLTPVKGAVLIQYEQRFTPGGTVPQWLADSVAESRVADALEHLQTLVENRRPLDDCQWHPDAGNGQRR
jgi:hypothetical protein